MVSIYKLRVCVARSNKFRLLPVFHDWRFVRDPFLQDYCNYIWYGGISWLWSWFEIRWDKDYQP